MVYRSTFEITALMAAYKKGKSYRGGCFVLKRIANDMLQDVL